MRAEVQKLIQLTKESEKERQTTIDEIRKIKENYRKQKELQADYEWEQQSRQFHWQNTLAQMQSLTAEKPQNMKFKTILQE